MPNSALKLYITDPDDFFRQNTFVLPSPYAAPPCLHHYSQVFKVLADFVNFHKNLVMTNGAKLFCNFKVALNRC